MIVIVIVGLTTRPEESRALREAKARLASAHAPLPPLHKPEPSELLSQPMSPAQLRRIREIDGRWQVRKKALLASMASFQTDPTKAGPSLSRIQAGADSYSQLSRQYDAERALAWQQALEVLK